MVETSESIQKRDTFLGSYNVTKALNQPNSYFIIQ